MRIVGIDEAGFGPLLGPFSMVAVETVWAEEPADLWELLQASVRRSAESADDRIPVGDSKAIHRPQKGFGPLLSAVAPFLRRMGVECDDSNGLLETLGAGGRDPEVPWNDERFSVELSMDALDVDWKVAESAGLEAVRAHLVFLDPDPFNQTVRRAGNKSDLLFHCLVELCDRMQLDGPAELHIGKHGGKKFYEADLNGAYPMRSCTPLRETAEHSLYEVLFNSGPAYFHFWRDAEDRQFETGLASMIAKLARELSMESFNRYWREVIPEVSPTAGYTVDARRFLDEIEPARNPDVVPLDRLVRCC